MGDTRAYHFDTNTWRELEPDTAPSERGWYAAVYNTKAQRVILFGGGPDPSESTDEAWIYNPETDTLTNGTPSP